MKRTLTAISAVLYLAACWAPQLWTERANADEKSPEFDEVRAQRFVLVDRKGKEVGVFESRASPLGPRLVLLGPSGASAEVGIDLFRNDGYFESARPGLLPDSARQAARLSSSWLRTYQTGGRRAKAEAELARRGLSPAAPGLALKFFPIPELSITRVSAGIAKRRVRLTADSVELENSVSTRALMGRVSIIDPDTGAETTTEGAFVSYDADGSVLWMEPR